MGNASGSRGAGDDVDITVRDARGRQIVPFEVQLSLEQTGSELYDLVRKWASPASSSSSDEDDDGGGGPPHAFKLFRGKVELPSDSKTSLSTYFRRTGCRVQLASGNDQQKDASSSRGDDEEEEVITFNVDRPNLVRYQPTPGLLATVSGAERRDLARSRKLARYAELEISDKARVGRELYKMAMNDLGDEALRRVQRQRKGEASGKTAVRRVIAAHRVTQAWGAGGGVEPADL